MAKAETGTNTKNRDNGNNIASSMEKKRGMPPEIAQMPRKHKKESKAGPTLSLHLHNRQER
jgi:hypothetical protein